MNELQAPKKILSRNRRSTALENQATFTNKIASNVKDSSSGGKREEVGLWLRERREARGLTQRALAEMIGSVYFTYISQVELGQSRIIPERWPQWADALDIELSVFAMRMLEAYDPIAYRMIFSSD
ncbi:MULTISPECIES: helix-turn-helix transcriptional regulator [unclassified Aminobacter]|uniref:helix-turn-helix domain-containing protein n=1 Tax=unclassified Aminobacter TaxID=2644704 RepID=UPI0016459D9D|nr:MULTISPECIES: helix-turn-helix transcriptional regulator [unclassified Aminobacter]